MLEDDSFITKHKQGNNSFIRQRKLSFSDCVLFPCFFQQSDLQTSLNEYFQSKNNNILDLQHVDRSAFSHARKKFKHDVYKDLNSRFLDDMSPVLSQETFHGFQILSIDGSTGTLPLSPELIEEFGRVKSRSGVPSYPKARLSLLYDSVNEVIVDSIIDEYALGEHSLFNKHLDSLNNNERRIIVLDRGYEGSNIFKKVISKNSHYCCRMRNQWNVVKNFINNSEQNDIIVEVNHSRDSIKKAKLLGTDTSPFKMRLVKIQLEDSVEILGTSILDKKFDLDFFKSLYHLRWRVEEGYKVLKCRIQIEKFMGKSVEAIKQEFYARVLMLNITMCQVKEVEKELRHEQVKRKLKYKINIKSALSKVKRVGVLLFTSSLENVQEILLILYQKMKVDLTPIRPNRRFSHLKRVSTALIQNYGTI